MPPTQVFSLEVLPPHLSIASDDAVTALAAAGGLLWVGTELGRLLRYDSASGSVSEMRNRLGSSRLSAGVARVFVDPFSRGALVILRNADAYYAAAKGELRPRWLSKLRGMRCVAATFVRVPKGSVGGRKALWRSASAGGKGEEDFVVVALLGTAFGSVFLLTLDVSNERDDYVQKVWAAPSGEHIDGIRVERIAKNFVGTVATASALYTLYGTGSLEKLFSAEEGDAVHRVEDMPGAAAKAAGGFGAESRAAAFEAPLPSELQFMSGTAGSGVASRRFVWAAHGGILHAQLALRSRRGREAGGDRGDGAAITASVTEKSVVTWRELKEKSGSAVPMACNLSTFHTLVLYPGSVYAYNQISGEMTQVLHVWNPEKVSSAVDDAHGSDAGNADAAESPGESVEPFLSSPAAGFVRDAVVDSLWVYTVDGQIARIVTGEEEQRVAWLAAKTVGRFDLAMALAPLVSGAHGTGGDVFDFAQSREAVLEAQADHAAANGDWDAAARLYAKTNRPIEAVIVDIVDFCARDAGSRESQPRVSLHAVGSGAGLDSDAESSDSKGKQGAAALENTIKHMSDAEQTSSGEATKLIIAYLVSKLDTIPESRPSQRTIVGMLLVQLYASCISKLGGDGSELREDFGHFLIDHSADLHVPTAVSVLCSHRCYEQAQTLCTLAADFHQAAEVAVLHASVEDALELVSNPALVDKPKDVADVLSTMTTALASRGPQRLKNVWLTAVRQGNPHLDHIRLMTALARVARSTDGSPQSIAAYSAAVGFARDVLQGHDEVQGQDGARPSAVSVSSSSLPGASSNAGYIAPLSMQWHSIVRLLFELHAESGAAAEAEASYDLLIRALERDESPQLRETLGDILMSGFRGKFWGLLVRVYGALGLHQAAVSLALEHAEDGGSAAAERHILGVDPLLSKEQSRSLWLQIAAASGVDVLGVVSRSDGALRVDDALPLMDDFSKAGPRVTSAVAKSLGDHQTAASSAAEDAKHTLGQTAAMRDDIGRADDWRRLASGAPCGHCTTGNYDPTSARSCPWCGQAAIASVDAPLL